MAREPKVSLTIRISRELRKDAYLKADERGEVLSEVIRKALERYVKRA